MSENLMYTCPMHPEVVSDKPGNCPKCGMKLVNKDAKLTVHKMADDSGLGKLSFKNYMPLIVVVLMILVASVVSSSFGEGEFVFKNFLLNFMTGFFLVFSGFKLMDLKGFAEGYATYDLLASRFKLYGYAYPFIELAFGLLMLAGYHPEWLLWTEFIVMGFSGLGVAIKLAKKEEFQCACLGTFLKVPLTKVTLIEDFGMAALALLLIFM